MLQYLSFQGQRQSHYLHQGQKEEILNGNYTPISSKSKEIGRKRNPI